MLLPAKIASIFFLSPSVFIKNSSVLLKRNWYLEWAVMANCRVKPCTILLPWQLVLGEKGLIESDFLQDFLLSWWIDLQSSNHFHLKLFCGSGILWSCSAVALWCLIRCLFSLQPMSVMGCFCSDLFSCWLLEICGRLIPCPLLCPLSEIQRYARMKE